MPPAQWACVQNPKKKKADQSQEIKQEDVGDGLIKRDKLSL